MHTSENTFESIFFKATERQDYKDKKIHSLLKCCTLATF